MGGYTAVYDAPQFQLNLQRKSLRSSLTTVGSFAAVLLVSLIGFVGGDNSNLWSFRPATMLSEPTEMLIGLMQIRANHISIMCELLTDWLMTYFSLIVAASSRRRITAAPTNSAKCGIITRIVFESRASHDTARMCATRILCARRQTLDSRGKVNELSNCTKLTTNRRILIGDDRCGTPAASSANIPRRRHMPNAAATRQRWWWWCVCVYVCGGGLFTVKRLQWRRQRDDSEGGSLSWW